MVIFRCSTIEVKANLWPKKNFSSPILLLLDGSQDLKDSRSFLEAVA